MILFPAAAFISTRVMNVTLYRKRSRNSPRQWNANDTSARFDIATSDKNDIATERDLKFNGGARRKEKEKEERKKKNKTGAISSLSITEHDVTSCRRCEMLRFINLARRCLRSRERINRLEILIGFR